ncbi:MAG: peptide chain release factor 2 [Candidatus Tagabacteria bacterium CG09_land_8_20_14_0_10_41_14]|uniref:Peptide chain release factor 2 n=2 Tax=Candidatus Tagaibacteriota TaxID=1817918 RepID=A0A2H0WLV8_9BACT|nr:MAG: peptide chain release factor 2 [Candidatus Tagabacteria bacterium CG09_land_8_20_14_0_10_41_14]PJE72808.1 MAG: peptide chain release factor 2 [Candidatus Tagabacteria bacterium CG10_big_fil_rev_8_21_14_0_10_40_13]
MNIEEYKSKLKQLEERLQKPDFWADKENAQAALKEINQIKEKLSALNKYDKGDAVVTIQAGAGGEDAEDWARILFDMYQKFAEKNGWGIEIFHESRNDTGGLKNITFELSGKKVYGEIKGENGVHRLVRISPFSPKKLRHTSFALVEVLPRFVEEPEIELRDEDIEVDFSRSSGPGGQNVNKRETAVRIKHIPTGISVHVETERSQAQNRERAKELLRSKLFKIYKEHKKEELKKLKGKRIEPEWGSQIRSYVFHPYKMVKDHRTEVETSNVESVLEGNLEEFVEVEKNI